MELILVPVSYKSIRIRCE